MSQSQGGEGDAGSAPHSLWSLSLFDPNTLALVLVICEDNKSQALGEVNNTEQENLGQVLHGKKMPNKL